MCGAYVLLTDVVFVQQDQSSSSQCHWCGVLQVSIFASVDVCFEQVKELTGISLFTKDVLNKSFCPFSSHLDVRTLPPPPDPPTLYLLSATPTSLKIGWDKKLKKMASNTYHLEMLKNERYLHRDNVCWSSSGDSVCRSSSGDSVCRSSSGDSVCRSSSRDSVCRSSSGDSVCRSSSGDSVCRSSSVDSVCRSSSGDSVCRSSSGDSVCRSSSGDSVCRSSSGDSVCRSSSGDSVCRSSSGDSVCRSSSGDTFLIFVVLYFRIGCCHGVADRLECARTSR